MIGHRARMCRGIGTFQCAKSATPGLRISFRALRLSGSKQNDRSRRVTASSQFKFQTASLVRSRGRFPAGVFRSFLSIWLPPKEGAERRNGAYSSIACSCEEHVPVLRSTSLALRRSTAAFSIPGAPLPSGPVSAVLPPGGREGVKDIDPRPHNGPGGCPPRTPGSTACETVRAGAAPHPRSVSPRRTPLGEWG